MLKSMALVSFCFVITVSALAQWTPPTTAGTVTGPIYYNGGFVGIGTTAPSTALHVNGDVTMTQNLAMDSATLRPWAYGKAIQGRTGGYFFGQSGDIHMISNAYVTNVGTGWKYIGDGTASNFYMYLGDTVFRTTASGAAGADVTWTNTVIIKSTGNVGIGTTAPSEKLDVNGNINVTGSINAKYQDVAEWVPATGTLKSGTVVVVNRATSNTVTASISAYDTAVAGVVSDEPGVLLGVATATSAKIATTGRVRVRVDAGRRAIRIGDLLVTSDIPGVAMGSEPVDVGGVKIHRPGTLIGKALEPLATGSGKILVLLSLQ